MKLTIAFDNEDMSEVEMAVTAVTSVIDIVTDGMTHAQLNELYDSIKPYVEVIPDWDQIEWDDFNAALEGENG